VSVDCRIWVLIVFMAHVGVSVYHINIAKDARIDSILFGSIFGVWMNPVMALHVAFSWMHVHGIGNPD